MALDRTQDGDPVHIEEAEEVIDKLEREYCEKKPKRWIYGSCGMIIFGTLAYLYATGVYYMSYTQFDTVKYESILTKNLSGLKLKDALTDEVFIISYSYN